MNVNVRALGALTHSLRAGKTVVEGDNLTVAGLLDCLIARYGPRMAEELMDAGGLRKGWRCWSMVATSCRCLKNLKRPSRKEMR